MHPVAKAIWFIESHFGRPISLDEVARVAGMSRHHLSRRFSGMTGQTLASYLRARRLSEAARHLAEGAGDILGVALDAGYGSHEAFTRAFRAEFGITPEMLRKSRDLSGLTLQEPLRMTAIAKTDLPTPRFETRSAFIAAGLAIDLDQGKSAAIPALWQRLNTHFGHVPGQIGREAFGLCWTPAEGRTRYLAAVRVASADDLPAGFETLSIPAQTYAVFPHADHVNGIPATIDAAFRTWLPVSGRKLGAFPDVFELYGEDFDPQSGRGKVEIWLPLAD